MSVRCFLTTLALCLAIAAAMGTEGRAEPLRPVVLQLQWHHQFQFAGYYAAVEQGYYRDAGLDVAIRPAKGDDDPVAAVLSGSAHFGVSSADLIVARSKGQPVVVLAPIFQHSPFALITLQSRGFDNVQSLAGQPLMIESHGAELLVFMQDEGLSADALIRRPHTRSITPLLDGRVAGMSAYVTDEPFALRELEIRYNVVTPRSGGIDFYGDTLFTSEDLLNGDREMVEAFRDASLKGWTYAMEHPEEIVDLILKRYSRDQSRAHLMFEARETEKLILPSIVEIGHSNPGRWRHIADIFKRAGMMDDAVDFDAFLYRPLDVLPGWVRPAVLGGIAGTVLFAGMAGAIGFMALRLRREVAQRRAVQAELERMALTDPLTALDNRRSFFAVMERELERAKRSGGKPGLILLDLDRFKSLNDTLGHPAGDAALKAVGELLHEIVRPSDVAARMGGEEFGLLIADGAEGALMRIAERARSGIEALTFDWHGQPVSLTASFGVALVAQGDTPNSLYERSDRALLAAKEAGRNRVVASADPIPA